VSGIEGLVGTLFNDVLSGDAGANTFDGRGGSDTYVFGANFGNDTITESVSGDGDVDTLRFDSVGPERLWFERRGNDLRIDVAGSTDSVTVMGWYSGASTNPATQMERILAGGKMLQADQVNALVGDMARTALPLPGSGNAAPLLDAAALNAVNQRWRTAV